jgi:hypothetical protein
VVHAREVLEEVPDPNKIPTYILGANGNAEDEEAAEYVIPEPPADLSWKEQERDLGDFFKVFVYGSPARPRRNSTRPHGKKI